MFVFARKNILIQYRPDKNVDSLSRQMALERDQSLGHTLYTLSELNIYLPAHRGSQEDLFSSTLDVREAGRQQQARFVPTIQSPGLKIPTKANCLPVTSEPGLDGPLCPCFPIQKTFPGIFKRNCHLASLPV